MRGLAIRARQRAPAWLATPTAISLLVTAVAGVVAVAVFAAVNDVRAFEDGTVVTCALGIAVILVALPRPWAVAAAVAAVVATWLLVYAALSTVPDVVDSPPPVDAAVGGAALFGTPYVPNQIAAALVAALVLGVALASSLVAKLRARRAPAGSALDEGDADPPRPEARRAPAAPALDHGEVDPPSQPPSRRPAIVVAAGTALVALAVVPLLGTSLVDNYRGRPPDWDGQNLIAWEHAIHRGLRPMRDFFWPYGETWPFYRYPEGVVLYWASQAVTLAIAAWALWRLVPTHGRAVRVLVGVAFLGLLAVWTPFTWRYGLPFLLVAVYVAIGPARADRPGRGHLVLALTAVFVALYELSSLLAGAAGCVFAVIAAALATGLHRDLRVLARRLAIDLLPFLAGIGVLGLAWVVQGTVQGNLRWWLGARAISADSAPDEQIAGALLGGVKVVPTLDMVFVGLPLVLLAAGLCATWRADRRRAIVAQLAVGAAAISLLLLAKHLVRPQGVLTLIAPLIVLGWGAVILWRPDRLSIAVVCGAFAGMLLYSLQQQDAVTRHLDLATGAPDRMVESMRFAADRDRVVRTSAARFAVESYPGWDAEPSLAAQLEAARMGGAERSFAVLGDAQGLYFLLDQPPPYHVQLYNAGPREEQEAMIDALARERPAFVLWRRDVVIDAVPQTLRAPLVLAWVIENYAPSPAFGPVKPGGPTDVLVPRGRRPVPLAWWSSRLGSSLDLGYVPASSDGEEEERCTGGEGCARYAILVGKSRRRGEQAVLSVTGPPGSFRVAIRTDPEVDEYPIRLDRLWFVRYLGGAVRLSAATPGWRVRDVRVRAGEDLF